MSGFDPLDTAAQDRFVAPLDGLHNTAEINGEPFSLGGLSSIAIDVQIEARTHINNQLLEWTMWVPAASPGQEHHAVRLRPVTLQNLGGNVAIIKSWVNGVFAGIEDPRPLRIYGGSDAKGGLVVLEFAGCSPTSADEGFTQGVFALLTLQCEWLQIPEFLPPVDPGLPLGFDALVTNTGGCWLAGSGYAGVWQFSGGATVQEEFVNDVSGSQTAIESGLQKHFTPVTLTGVVSDSQNGFSIESFLNWINAVTTLGLEGSCVDIFYATIEIGQRRHGGRDSLVRHVNAILTRVTLFNPLGRVLENGGFIPGTFDITYIPERTERLAP